jgi:hypothetical protein
VLIASACYSWAGLRVLGRASVVVGGRGDEACSVVKRQQRWVKRVYVPLDGQVDYQGTVQGVGVGVGVGEEDGARRARRL